MIVSNLRSQIWVIRGTVAAGGLAMLLALGTLARPAGAQEAAKEKSKIPPAEHMTLETKDGVLLRCTFYPGTRKKQAIPIILLHGWEGQRTDYDYLASGLQRMGHAVIAPDLRGHGESVNQRLPNGDQRRINRDRMRRADFESMIADVEAVKRFLMEKNNAGELNIELLCVIGADMGALVGLNWSAQDWSWAQTPALKQGQDVKAMVLLSPMDSFQGMTVNDAAKHPLLGRNLSLLVVAGSQDRRAYQEARRVYKRFERFHGAPPKDPDERRRKQALFFVGPDTLLQGTKLLTARGLNVNQTIVQFLHLRLINRQDEFAWTDRRSPLSR